MVTTRTGETQTIKRTTNNMVKIANATTSSHRTMGRATTDIVRGVVVIEITMIGTMAAMAVIEVAVIEVAIVAGMIVELEVVATIAVIEAIEAAIIAAIEAAMIVVIEATEMIDMAHPNAINSSNIVPSRRRTLILTLTIANSTSATLSSSARQLGSNQHRLRSRSICSAAVTVAITWMSRPVIRWTAVRRR